MKRFTWRDLEDRDAQTICSFVASAREAFHAFPKASWPLTSEQILHVAYGRDGCTVFLDLGQVAGYANFYEVSPGEFCTLGNLMVSPAHRRKGLARFVVQTMAHKAFGEFGAREIRAGCFNDNVPAMLLYHRMGFKPVEIRPRKGPQGEDIFVVMMSRDLGAGSVEDWGE